MFNAKFLEKAKDLIDLTSRMTVLTTLCDLPDGVEFYADDLKLNGGIITALVRYGIIEQVPGKEKTVFVCIDESADVYKKFEANCWIVANPFQLREQLQRYCHNMALFYTSRAKRLG